ncbi:hypothetical protein Desca_1328 [Desulfotomaculum nigrificans CO-1-SRB]|uniref:Uncharacterized protein n=1 Tax=Desulfotomaculum nigrificans (strain DSM 14880 / VKM B-2319 / CO-1-SRB) TaxID=868595 RepID=F6B4S5_DESCC|nr:hypothetical protein [Desulfotomaculum nigrificans]AEF94187.1 hypothetical protein Desca_1328 [Desulfotomaculum nigrificans CO-1-SRB]
MNYLLALVPLAVGAYTISFAVWLWQQKNKRGAVGTILLTVLTLLLSFYAIFIRQGFE